MRFNYNPIRILLVEDNPADVVLIKQAFSEVEIPHQLSVCRDGQEGLEYLRKENSFQNAETPDLVLLDINMPRLNGLELLEIIKTDDIMGVIPVVILTTSESEEDILKSYQLHVSSYIRKPVEFSEFLSAIQQIQEYWFSIVKYPMVR